MNNIISTKKVILYFILLILIFLIANKNPFIIQIQNQTKQQILDISFNLSTDQMYNFLDNLGEIGRKSYLNFLIIIDMIFPAAYSILGFLILSYFFQRTFKKENFLNNLKYIILLTGFLDILQNIFEIFLLIKYPEKMILAAKILNVITNIKIISVNISFTILLLIILIFFFIKLFLKKKINIEEK
jgi:hypothetical protein